MLPKSAIICPGVVKRSSVRHDDGEKISDHLDVDDSFSPRKELVELGRIRSFPQLVQANFYPLYVFLISIHQSASYVAPSLDKNAPSFCA